MKLTISRILFILSVISGAVGGVLYDRYRNVSVSLLAFGVVGTILAYLSSEKKQSESEAFFEATTRLLIGIGAGNPYTAIVRRQLAEGEKHKNLFSMLEKALNFDPNDADALLLYVVRGALHLSLEHLIGPNHILRDMSAHRKCAILTERGIRTGKHLSQFYAVKGMLFDEIERFAEARAWYEKSGKLRPDPYWRLLSSTSYGMERRFDDAFTQMEKAIDEGARGSLVDFYYGRCLSGIGEYDRAIAMFKRVRKNRGLFYELSLEFKDAYWFSWHPVWSAYYELLSALLVFRRSWRKGLEHLRGVLKASLPAMLWGSNLAQRIVLVLPIDRTSKFARFNDPGNPHVSLGMSLVRSGNITAAKKMFVVAAAHSNRLNSWMNLCGSAIATGDWEQAERAYLYLMERWPNEVPPEYEAIIRSKNSNRVDTAPQFDDVPFS